MSFSYDLKKELSGTEDAARHCRMAELAALVFFLGQESSQGSAISLTASGELPVLKASVLIRKLYGAAAEPVREPVNAQPRFRLDISDEEICGKLRKTLKCAVTENGRFLPDTAQLTQKNCCRRAFLRGAFLCAGTISDPDKSYHLEINCKTAAQAGSVKAVLLALGIDAGMTKRERYESVYIKNGDQIFEVLALMGARITLLELENRRILRSMRGNVNRIVNCETANIGKTAEAAARQIEDIRLINETDGQLLFEAGLDEAARIRVEYPEATLTELAQMMNPPIGRSGMNHRLRKIHSIAESLREGKM